MDLQTLAGIQTQNFLLGVLRGPNYRVPSYEYAPLNNFHTNFFCHTNSSYNHPMVNICAQTTHYDTKQLTLRGSVTPWN